MSARRSLEDLRSRTRFEPREAEPRLLAEWLASGVFHPAPLAGENYSIAFPPPNVTGDLHMGHALQAATQDTLIRAARQRGQRAKFILGTDHAGIATQMQVERQLAREGSSRVELGRERFEQRVWQWRELYGPSIIERLKQIGASFDYEEERFTLDERYAQAVVKVFVELFERGYIHRDHYMVNWDPGSGSAISDLEVEQREETDELFSIAYPLADSDAELVVATVRPETMLADVAVAVHPDDERYKHLVGRHVILPLVGRRLPIIADDYVKMDFGTGALKITPGHDPNDFEIGRRHDLPVLSVIGEDGRMNEDAGKFAGLSVEEAQLAVVKELEEAGALRAREPYVHEVPYSQRSGRRIEPLISLQWFMRMDDLARPAIEAVRHGKVRFFPERWGEVYLDWMEGIRPWCVSRQLWWGHRLPVYYCDACEETYVAASPPERCGACDGPLRQDEDVLDTWFSSALWPFATLGWPEQTPELAAFYPTNVLVTGRDIINLWVARMIMMGLEFRGEVPFRDVYITSIIQAPDGRRMSKSLGTGVDPIDAIEAHGADAVRFGLLVMSSSQDVRYSVEKIEQGQGLANKLFNASRLVVLSIDPQAAPVARPSAIEDRWMLARLLRIDRQLHDRIGSYDFAHAALELYDFIYGELCDWYLELIKPRLREPGPELSSTLRFVLRETLALAHPLIPFVTEEMWAYVREDAEGLLAGHARARLDGALADPAAEAAIERVIAATQAVRSWRDSVAVAPGARVVARIDADGYDEVAHLVAVQARLELRDRGSNGAEPQATIPIPGGAMAILEGIDAAAAAQRTAKRREKLLAEIERARTKLANPAFTANAPPEIIAKEQHKLSQLEEELKSL
ncbi:MAG: valine--tRNA ligase [Solirubrobacteraceae bacterium]